MKKFTYKLMTTLVVFAVTMAILTGCKSKPKDADLKAAVETLLQAKPNASAITVSVDKGVATLNGEVTDENTKEELGKSAAGIMGIKSVVNKLTVKPVTTAPVTIAMDDPLNAAVKDAIKDFPTVTSSVSDGAITLKGEIQKADLQKLMMVLQSLKPKKVENTQLVIK